MYSLKSVTIPGSVTCIGEYAFGYNNGKIDGFTIIGSNNSAAKRYAIENGFNFIEIKAFVKGDVDGDGEVSITDATMIQFYLAGFINFDEAQIKAADVNNDGTVSIADVTKIQYVLAGLEQW